MNILVELATGDTVTVTEAVCNLGDTSYQKQVFEVKAIDLPLIVVQRLDGYGTEKAKIIDTRNYKLKRLSKEFVAAILSDEMKQS